MNRSFWIRWIIATTLGMSVGGIVGYIVFLTLYGGNSDLSSLFVSSVFGSGLWGIIFGFAQWTILRGHIVNSRRWILATIASLVLGSTSIVTILRNDVNTPIFALVGIALLSITFMGISQGSVLGKSKIRRWLVMTYVAVAGFAFIGFIFSVLGFFVLREIFALIGIEGWTNLGFSVYGAAIAGSIAGAITYGAITGKALIEILKK